jgi:hypothetical protein
MNDYIDKLLVLCVLLFTGLMVIYMVNAHVDDKVVTWAMRGYDNLQGGFLTLLTGGALRAVLNSQNNKPKPPDASNPTDPSAKH